VRLLFQFQVCKWPEVSVTWATGVAFAFTHCTRQLVAIAVAHEKRYTAHYNPIVSLYWCIYISKDMTIFLSNLHI